MFERNRQSVGPLRTATAETEGVISCESLQAIAFHERNTWQSTRSRDGIWNSLGGGVKSPFGVTEDESRPGNRAVRIIHVTLTLTPGTRLGVYDITAQIGEGGMGQVFRATDTKLKRQVAIKILPPSLTADHERLARSQREAEVLASLNHPNIAAIYGLEEGGGVSALVMELVEGDDLSQRIARGAIPPSGAKTPPTSDHPVFAEST